METGDEAMSAISRFAAEHGVGSAQFSAIGAFSEVVVGYYDFNTREYKKTALKEQLEVLSINGDISHYNGQIKVHAHAVLGRADATVRGGHLMKGIAHPTLEVILIESPVWLKREMDEAAGIPLIKIDS